MRTVSDTGTVEEIRHKGDTIEVKQTFDVLPAIEHARALRNSELVGDGHWRHVASLDARLIDKLCKEAGIPPHDTKGRKEHMKKLLLDGTLAKFRVWEGKF